MRHLLVREIEINLDSVRARFVLLCVFFTCAAPAIPICAVVGLLGWPCIRGYLKDEQETLLLLLAGVGISLVVFGLPIGCVIADHRAFGDYAGLLRDREVSHIEIYSPIFCYLVLLYLAAYVSVVSLDIETIVDHAKRARFNLFGSSPDVNLVPLDTTTPTRVRLQALAKALEGLPGWARFEKTEVAGEESPVRRTSPTLSDAAVAGGEFHGREPGSLDYVTFGAHNDRIARHEAVGAYAHLHKVVFFFKQEGKRCQDWPLSTALMICFGCARALVPRLWARFYWGHAFIPPDPYVGAMVVHGLVLTAVTSVFWLVVFNNARLAYAANANQMKLVSALVHLEKRHTYLKTVIAPHCTNDTAGRAKFKELSHKLPYFTMDSVDNIRAWWLLREFAVIDSLDERMTLEITMLLVLAVMTLMIGHSMWDFAFASVGTLTSFQVLSLLDLSWLGVLSLCALSTYVQMNDIMRDQADILINARHGILTPETKLMDMTDVELKLALASGATSHWKAGVPMSDTAVDAAEFLTHLSEVIRVDDYIQTMFGVEITAFNLAQVVLGMIAGIGSCAGVLYEMLAKSFGSDVLSTGTMAVALSAPSFLQQWGQ